MFVCFPGMVGPKEGVLGLEDESAENTQAVLVASPEQKRTARKLRSRAASTAAARSASACAGGGGGGAAYVGGGAAAYV